MVWYIKGTYSFGPRLQSQTMELNWHQC